MTTPPTGDLGVLIDRARAGRVRAVARLLSLVENDGPELPDVMAALAPLAGGARVIGLTGAPGVGKSTTTNALVTELRNRGLRVAVLAVDPSSPRTGGSLLGDRIRMQRHVLDEGVFIRSMSSRGHFGGLAAATGQAIRVFDAAGFDVVLLETVGVGQSEVDVGEVADTTLILLAPGMGDGVQSAKAGLLEIGDIYVVNKADREGARELASGLRTALAVPGRSASAWRPTVLLISAERGTAINDLVEALDRHHSWLEASGELDHRRLRRARSEVEALLAAAIRTRRAECNVAMLADRLASDVAAGECSPHEAAAALLTALASPTSRPTNDPSSYEVNRL